MKFEDSRSLKIFYSIGLNQITKCYFNPKRGLQPLVKKLSLLVVED